MKENQEPGKFRHLEESLKKFSLQLPREDFVKNLESRFLKTRSVKKTFSKRNSIPFFATAAALLLCMALRGHHSNVNALNPEANTQRESKDLALQIASSSYWGKRGGAGLAGERKGGPENASRLQAGNCWLGLKILAVTEYYLLLEGDDGVRIVLYNESKGKTFS